MVELGTKFVCFSCEAKFYDMGRPEPVCPKCGANQKEAGEKPAEPEPRARSKKRTGPREVVRSKKKKESADEDDDDDEEPELDEDEGDEDEGDEDDDEDDDEPEEDDDED